MNILIKKRSLKLAREQSRLKMVKTGDGRAAY